MTTTESEAMPTAQAKGFHRASSTIAPTASWAMRKILAWREVTWPEGSGRERVRSTMASMSRSTRSL